MGVTVCHVPVSACQASEMMDLRSDRSDLQPRSRWIREASARRVWGSGLGGPQCTATDLPVTRSTVAMMSRMVVPVPLPTL